MVCAHLEGGGVMVKVREDLPARLGWGCRGRPWRISSARLRVEPGRARGTGRTNWTDLYTRAQTHIQVEN